MGRGHESRVVGTAPGEASNGSAPDLVSMREVVSRLRRPAFTGANRCWPCTGINAVILLVVAAGVAIVSIPAAVGVVLAGTAAIALRGYFVPFTPQFAPRLEGLLPWSVHDPDEREGGSVGDPAGVAGEDVLETLVEADVIVEDGDRLEPTDTFAERWATHMDELVALDLEALLAETRETVTGAAEVKSVDHGTRQYVVLHDGSGEVTGESWVRRPKAIAEVAGIRAMAGAGIAEETALAAADPLCLFLTDCPSCRERLEERPAGGCCGAPRTDPEGRPIMAMVCPSCRTHFHVME